MYKESVHTIAKTKWTKQVIRAHAKSMPWTCTHTYKQILSAPPHNVMWLGSLHSPQSLMISPSEQN